MKRPCVTDEQRKRAKKKVPKEIFVRPDLYNRYEERDRNRLNHQTSCSPFPEFPFIYNKV